MGFKKKAGKKIHIRRVLKESDIAKIRTKVTKVASGVIEERKEERDIKADAKEWNEDDLDMIVSDEENPDHIKTGRYRADEDALQLRRKQILRLLLRGVPKPTIRAYLKISNATLYRDIDALNDSMRNEINNFDVPLFVGYTVSFYDEIRNIALRLATNKSTVTTTEIDLKTGKKKILKKDVPQDPRIVNLSLQTALKAESDKHAYLRLTGLYGEVEKKGALYKGAMDDSNKLTHDDTGDFSKFINSYFGESKRKEPETA